MTNFTKQQLKDLRNEMQGVLLTHPFEEAIDLQIDKIHIGNCTYNGGEATYKVTVLLDGAETKSPRFSNARIGAPCQARAIRV